MRMNRWLVVSLCLAAAGAWAEAGLPYFEVCASPPCACGVEQCSCGQICSLGRCQSAQQGYCSSDSQCGPAGTCGSFVCDFNVCTVNDGGVRPSPVPDAGAQVPSTPPGGCSAAPGLGLAALAVWVRLRRRAR